MFMYINETTSTYLKVMFAENFKDRENKREGSAMDSAYDAKRSRNDSDDGTYQ